MEPMLYVMAILGCGDGVGPCTQARVLPARYASVAACQAELPKRLAENTDVPFPSIMADCRASGRRLVKAEGSAKPRG